MNNAFLAARWFLSWPHQNSRVRCDPNFSNSSSNPLAGYQSVRLLSWHQRCRKKVAWGGARAQRVRNPWISYAAEKELCRSDRNWTISSPCSLLAGPLSPFQGSLRPIPIPVATFLCTFGAIVRHRTLRLSGSPTHLRIKTSPASPLQALVRLRS